MSTFHDVILRPGIGDDAPSARLLYGRDVLESLHLLPDESVHCVCTSPPFYGLRDYGTAEWAGGDPACDHGVIRWDGPKQTQGAQSGHAAADDKLGKRHCDCGAVREDRQIGVEPSPDCLGWATGDPCGECYVCRLVTVFREVKRVLRDDGVLWLNLGDSFANDGKWGVSRGGKHVEGLHGDTGVGRGKRRTGLKPKDLIGVPWRTALALQADGWWLRSDVIWSKDNCMPESVRDRPTKSHEYVFLFAKNTRYFYDTNAIKEPHKFNRWGASVTKDASVLDAVHEDKAGKTSLLRAGATAFHPEGGRNKRTVWTVNPRGYPGAHFATWPEALVTPMVLAGSSRHVCGVCGAPWKRVTTREPAVPRTCRNNADRQQLVSTSTGGTERVPHGAKSHAVDTTLGFETPCGCGAESRPGVVLDPFSGSATTGKVALNLGRNYIGIDLNPEYLPLAEARIRGDPAPAGSPVTDTEYSLFDLFEDSKDRFEGPKKETLR